MRTQKLVLTEGYQGALRRVCWGCSIGETEQVGYLYKIHYKAMHLLQSKPETCRVGYQERQAGILQHRVKLLPGEFSSSSQKPQHLPLKTFNGSNQAHPHYLGIIISFT